MQNKIEQDYYLTKKVHLAAGIQSPFSPTQGEIDLVNTTPIVKARCQSPLVKW